LYPGIGYGGSCFPKDVKALAFSAKSVGMPLNIIEATQNINYLQTERFFARISGRFGNDLSGKKIAIWGLAFKPNTDDVREAPAHRLIVLLLRAGATIACYDPEAIENTRKIFGDKIEYFTNMYDVLDNAETLVICTEWNIFRVPDFESMKKRLNNNVIFDGRNLYSPDDMAKNGFEYYSIGRHSVQANRI
jgi:UDPglucose 6-dehydrogenase